MISSAVYPSTRCAPEFPGSNWPFGIHLKEGVIVNVVYEKPEPFFTVLQCLLSFFALGDIDTSAATQ